MKLPRFFAVSGVVVAGALSGIANVAEKIESGVTYQLAQKRKELVDSLRYSLRFSIPENPAENVEANEKLSFIYHKGSSLGVLPIDFAGGIHAVKSLSINGQRLIPSFEANHILLPDSLLNDGNNVVEIGFSTSGGSMNRRSDYLFTLFVPFKAHACFPCFDQPDLKARYDLTLELPGRWRSVANGAVVSDEISTDGNRHTVTYRTTEPLSSYLFAFAAGEFNHDIFEVDRRKIGIFHREKDPQKLAQLSEIAQEVASSLKWLEEYTATPYPFMKYDLAILPGFPFSGMEHTGATFYNDSKLFLGTNPTPDECLARTSLIAHETAHMWFGDYVTMRWFDDVWTKEVFANYFGAAITRDLASEFDHSLQWLRRYQDAAMSLDRTQGATAIRQPLPNMLDAGLIYNNIIYNKAPVMMAKLRDLMGEESFRTGIQRYLKSFAYSNASWPELIDILAEEGGEKVREFSKAWVEAPGCPRYKIRILNDSLLVSQTDLHGSATVWPQRFGVRLIKGGDVGDIEVEMQPAENEARFLLPKNFRRKKNDGVIILPNYDGRGYGVFDVDQNSIRSIIGAFGSSAANSILNRGVAVTPSGRVALLLNLRELFLRNELPIEDWSGLLLTMLNIEADPLLALSEVTWLGELLPDADNYEEVEAKLRNLTGSVKSIPLRISIYRVLASYGRSRESEQMIYDLWKKGDKNLLGEGDLTDFTYQLALRRPAQADEILAIQLNRISNSDRLDTFNFISRAVSPRQDERDAMFADLLIAENRRQEPRALKALSLLTHFLRGDEAVNRIEPALEILPEVQAFGDIFLPANWCGALLSHQRSVSARLAVTRYLESHRDLKPLLRNKILGALNPRYPLF